MAKSTGEAADFFVEFIEGPGQTVAPEPGDVPRGSDPGYGDPGDSDPGDSDPNVSAPGHRFDPAVTIDIAPTLTPGRNAPNPVARAPQASAGAPDVPPPVARPRVPDTVLRPTAETPVQPARSVAEPVVPARRSSPPDAVPAPEWEAERRRSSRWPLIAGLAVLAGAVAGVIWSSSFFTGTDVAGVGTENTEAEAGPPPGRSTTQPPTTTDVVSDGPAAADEAESGESTVGADNNVATGDSQGASDDGPTTSDGDDSAAPVEVSMENGQLVLTGVVGSEEVSDALFITVSELSGDSETPVRNDIEVQPGVGTRLELHLQIKDSVLFALGSADISDEFAVLLDNLTVVLDLAPESNVLVTGHTDSSGSDEINAVLSRARADAVVDYLASRGVPEERMEAVGLGSSQPIADDSTAEGRRENRRIEIDISAE